MSKVKLSKIFPDVSPICDRKQAPATLYHIFWSCSGLTAFWASIFDGYSFIGISGVPKEDLLPRKPQINSIAYSSLFTRQLKSEIHTKSMGKFEVAWRPFISYVEQLMMSRQLFFFLCCCVFVSLLV